MKLPSPVCLLESPEARVGRQSPQPSVQRDTHGTRGYAEKTFRELLDMDRRRHGPDHPYVLRDMGSLAAMLHQEQKLDEAEKLYLDVNQTERRVLGPEHPDTLMNMGNLALVLYSEKRYADSEKMFRETLEIKRRRLGPEHRSTLVTMGNLADVLSAEGKYADVRGGERRGHYGGEGGGHTATASL